MSMSVLHESMRLIIQDLFSSVMPFDSIEEEHLNFVKGWIASGAEIFRITQPDNPPKS